MYGRTFNQDGKAHQVNNLKMRSESNPLN